MSKIGKKPIILPDKVTSRLEGNVLEISGPLGKLTFKIPEHLIDLLLSEGSISVVNKNDSKLSLAMRGTARSIINNMVLGVTQGYSRSLIIEGIGYKAALEQNKLKLEVGYSHPIFIEIPSGIKVQVEKNKITVSGIDKQLIGDFAARIRRVRIPDSYKGKGIKFENEILKLKPGKKAGAAAGAA